MRSRLTSAVAVALAVGSCGDVTQPCPTVTTNPQIQVPASNFPLPLDALLFPPINAATTSAPDGTMVSIAANQGTVAYGGRGPFPAFIFQQDVGFPDANSITYEGLGVADGVWFPFWLYCSTDGRLTAVYGEMSDQDVDVFPAVEGTCTDQGVGSTNPVSIPAHTLSPIALTCGFTVTSPSPNGPNLKSSSVGSMALWGGDLTSVYPFHTVDCRSGCGSPGWFEVHSILWDPTMQIAAFTIFYLDEMGVSIGNGIELPVGQSEGDGLPIGGATFTITR
jgi:hypothetical protein